MACFPFIKYSMNQTYMLQNGLKQTDAGQSDASQATQKVQMYAEKVGVRYDPP